MENPLELAFKIQEWPNVVETYNNIVHTMLWQLTGTVMTQNEWQLYLISSTVSLTWTSCVLQFDLLTN